MKEVWFARPLYILFGVAAPVLPDQLFSSCSSNRFTCLMASFELVIAAELSAAGLEAESSMLVVDMLVLFAGDVDTMPAPFLRRLIPWPASWLEPES